MKYIKKEELIIGEIYKSTLYNHIFKYLDKNGDKNPNISKTYNMFNKDLATIGHGLNKVINTTSEEKHWLNECIKLDKFITFEEAMKTFIPEYYQYIGENDLYESSFIKGKTYKIINKNDLEASFNFIDEKGTPDGYEGSNWIKFKPSTKEAYDAQFVVKEPEFVLPKKWCLKITNENLDFCKSLENKELHYPKNYNYCVNGYYSQIPSISGNYGFSGKPITHTEITFEQFKKYVLKEETPVQDFMKLYDEIIMKDIPLRPRGSVLMDINTIDKEIIEPLPQFKVIETIETITKVENNEGNQFFINDKIKVSLNMVQKIISFSYNEDKTEIFANFNQNLSISINDIEHYIEPKVEETLLEKAKIIEHSHDFKIGDKIKLKLDNGEFNFVFKIIKIEGNVLFFGNSIHSRVLAKNVIKVN